MLNLASVLEDPFDTLEVVLIGSDAERAPHLFDAFEFADRALRDLGTLDIEGLASSSDYPGVLVAAFIANELGLPGPSLRSVLTCAHKYYSRLAQRAAVPNATPRFALLDPFTVDPDRPPLPFPLFIKPVKSWFSQFAVLITNADELRAFLNLEGLGARLTEFVRPFNQLLSLFPEFTVNGGWLIVEEPLVGSQTTLEGYMIGSELVVTAIFDSLLHEVVPSFREFRCPSFLSSDVTARMVTLAAQTMVHIGFEQGIFNIEFIYDPLKDSLWIIEINPRMCGQFADLTRRLTGIGPHRVMLELALGHTLRHESLKPQGVGVSRPLRSLDDDWIRALPMDSEMSYLRENRGVSLFDTFYTVGERFSSNRHEWDGYSYRYGVLNMWAASSQHLDENLEFCLRFIADRLGVESI